MDHLVSKIEDLIILGTMPKLRRASVDAGRMR
jgi:hypothetical protein